MMRWQLTIGLPVTLATICLAGTSPGWAADRVTTKQPVKPKTSVRRVSEPKVGQPVPGPGVVPVNYSPVAELQDATVDEYETVRQQAQSNSSRLYRESRIARHHRMKREELRLEHENCKDWFNYIRGYGPVIWVRNGPELKWHPPSIPFAKRVGGSTAPHWQGVTDIPKQPDIPPSRVNQIHSGEVIYPNQE